MTGWTVLCPGLGVWGFRLFARSETNAPAALGRTKARPIICLTIFYPAGRKDQEKSTTSRGWNMPNATVASCVVGPTLACFIAEAMSCPPLERGRGPLQHGAT